MFISVYIMNSDYLRLKIMGGESIWGLLLYVKKKYESILGHFGDIWEKMASPNPKSHFIILVKSCPQSNGFGYIQQKSPNGFGPLRLCWDAERWAYHEP